MVFKDISFLVFQRVEVFALQQLHKCSFAQLIKGATCATVRTFCFNTVVQTACPSSCVRGPCTQLA